MYKKSSIKLFYCKNGSVLTGFLCRSDADRLALLPKNEKSFHCVKGRLNAIEI
jgi:hypothetical protein